jgi:nitroreductase
MLKEIVKKNRSYRRFYEDHKISREELIDLVELAKYSGSAKNLQPLKYILSWEEEKNEKIFQTLMWAGYLKDWDGPEKGERPSAYIVVLGDLNITKVWDADPGIVMQTILLGAVEKELGGCMFGSIKREILRKELNIPEHFQILYVIALGKPKEDVVVVDAKESIKYYRDENKIHYVPKRKLEDFITNI